MRLKKIAIEKKKGKKNRNHKTAKASFQLLRSWCAYEDANLRETITFLGAVPHQVTSHELLMGSSELFMSRKSFVDITHNTNLVFANETENADRIAFVKSGRIHKKCILFGANDRFFVKGHDVVDHVDHFNYVGDRGEISFEKLGFGKHA